ncbi:MAG: tyrosine-type recombinase/integrase [Euryarchaeota archaeon]|nr:tyrosine-type recombinase/integrase [Euryarchaeota archaeon]
MGTHNPKRKLETAFNNIIHLKTTPNNKNEIKEFIEFLAAQGVKELRQVKYIYALGNIALWLKKDFLVVSKKDIEKLCSDLEKGKYTAWTKHDYRVAIKKFYTWLRNKNNDDMDEWTTPKEVKWIKVRSPSGSKKLPSDLLTPEDIQLLVESCRNLREKSLILSVYETGGRIGEILNLKIRDFNPDDFGAMLNLNGKTGYRKIRIVGSAPAISQWLALEHPKRDDKEAFLFCNIQNTGEGEALSYDAADKLLKKIGARAAKKGFNKKVHFHLFRHSRLSELSEYMNDAPLRAFAGWRSGSNMSAVYTHIADTNKIILEMNGLLEKKKGETGGFREIVCPRCNTKNSHGDKYCSQCSLGLDARDIMEYTNIKKEALKQLDNQINVEAIIKMVMERLENPGEKK